MSRSFRKGRHPGNIARAQRSWACDHMTPIRNTGKVNRHLLQRLKRARWFAPGLRREVHIYDNERQAHCEFSHRHRLWNRSQGAQRFLREQRCCEEHTARKRDIAERIADWLEEQDFDAAEQERMYWCYEDERMDWHEDDEERMDWYEDENDEDSDLFDADYGDWCG